MIQAKKSFSRGWSSSLSQANPLYVLLIPRNMSTQKMFNPLSSVHMMKNFCISFEKKTGKQGQKACKTQKNK